MANEQKINDIIDIAAITKQVEATEQQLNRIIATIAEINKNGVTFKGSNTNTIPEATKQIDELGRANQKLANLQTEAGRAAYQHIQATKELTKTEQLQANATNELTGAWERARAKGQLLDKQARDLAFSMYEMEKAGKKGTAEYQKLETEFNKVSQEAFDFNAEIKKVDAGINIHSKNVGNYEGAVTSLRQEIKNLTQTLATMEMQGKGNTKEYDDMVRKLGQLKDAVGDVQARSKFWADDARYLNTVTQAVQGLVGAYSVWVGASELLGTKNEELEKIMRKMMALMTVMQGLQQVANMLNKDSYVRVAANVAIEKVRAYWTGVQTAATGAGTVAQRAFNVAVKANPIGLLVTVVTAAVAALIAYGRHVKEVTKIENEWIGANSELKKKYAEQKQSIETYLAIAKNANKSDEQRILALQKLREETGGIVTVTDLSSESLKKLDAQTNIYLETLYKQIKLEAAREKATELMKQTFDLQADNAKIANEVMSKNIVQLLFSYSPFGPAIEKIKDLYKSITTGTMQVKDGKQTLIDVLTEENNAQIAQNTILVKGLLNYINENTLLEGNTKAKGDNTKATVEQTEATEESNNADKVKEFLTHEQIESILQLMESRKQGNKVLSETEQLELEEAEVLQQAGEAVQQLMENIRDGQPAANEFLDWWKSLTSVEKAQNIVDLFSKLTGVVSDFSEISNNKGKQEVEEFKVQQDEKLRVLNERLRLGYITEEQYMAQKSDLELEFEAKKKEIEKREFERKKKLAYAEAVINGASAAIAALKEKTLAMKIISLSFVALTLAAQLAKIQAQTPGFAKGRKDGPATFAKVGEQGWEFTGDGTNIFKTPNSTTLTYLKPHQWVMPHNESVKLEKVLGAPTVNQITTQKPQQQDKELINAINKLAKKPTAIINMDKNGIRAALSDGNNTTNFVNNHILFRN